MKRGFPYPPGGICKAIGTKLAWFSTQAEYDAFKDDGKMPRFYLPKKRRIEWNQDAGCVRANEGACQQS